MKRLKIKSEKLIAVVASLAVVSVCGAVYFGSATDKGSSEDINPAGVAFAAPNSSDGHIQIDDGAVPLADSYENAGEINDYMIYQDSDELVEFDSMDQSGGDMIIDDPNSGNADNNELILDNPGSRSNELILDDPKPGNTAQNELILDDPKSTGSTRNELNLDDSNSKKNRSEKNKEDSKSSSDTVNISVLDELLLKKINELRASEGAGKLSPDTSLNEYAAVRAEEASVKWSHTRPDGTQGCDMISSNKYRAENLSCRNYSSFGYTQKEIEEAAEAMFSDLKASSVHYDNMTYKNFTKIGIRTFVSKSDNGKIRFTTAYMFSN